MAIKIVRNIPPFDTTNSNRKILYISGTSLAFGTADDIGITGSGGSGGNDDLRYVLTSSYHPFTASLNAFTASQSTINTDLNNFTASFSGSVRAIGDLRYVFTSSYNIFTASHNTFSQSINGFTASFSASVQALGDVRYLLTSSNYVSRLNEFTGNIALVAGNNVSITSGSGIITIAAIAASGTVFADDRYVLTSSLTSSVINVGDRRYVLTSSFDIFSGAINAFTASQKTLNDNLNLLTASLNTFSASQLALNNNLNGFTASFSGSVQSIGDSRYVQNLNGFTGSLRILAGPNITINSGSGFIMITGSAGGGGSTDTTGSDNFFIKNILQVSGSIVNPVGHLILSSSVGSITTVSGNLNVLGNVSSANLDARYVLTSSNYVRLLNEFTGAITLVAGNNISISSGSGIITIAAVAASGTIFADDRYVLTSSLTSSVIDVGDRRYTLTSSFNLFSGAINAFTASQNTLNAGLNGFTASFSASVNSVSDGRYVSNLNGYSGSMLILAGPNITINSGSGFVMLTASSTNVTGSDNFFVKSILQVSGNIVNPVGHLILSSTAGSTITVSGNLNIIGAVTSADLNSRYLSHSAVSSSIINVGDARYLLTSQFNPFGNSINAFTASQITINNLLNSFSASINGFTASFSSSVNSISDGRYVSNVNGYSGSLQILGGPWITVTSGSGFIMISGTNPITGSGGATDVTGSDNFVIKNTLQISGTIVNPIGHLILSSTNGSTVTVSGTLKVNSHVVENAGQVGVSVGNTAVIVDSYSTLDYRTMKYLFSISSGSSFQAQETLVLHSGTNVDTVEYAIISLPGDTFVGFAASITGSTLNIIASGSNTGNTIKFIRNAVVI